MPKLVLRFLMLIMATSKMLHLQMPELDASGQMRTATRTLKVNVPPGASAGQQLRLAQQGAPGMGGGPAWGYLSGDRDIA